MFLNKKTISIIAVSLILIGVMIVLTMGDIFDNRKKISFWQFWNPEWIKPAIEKFEKLHPEYRIVIETLTWETGETKIVTAMSARQAPDVLEIGSTWVAGFGSEGGLREIVEMPPQLRNADSAKLNGKYYALPWTLSTNALFYNKKLLAEAGITNPPNNWESLLEASQLINRPSKEIYGYGIKSGKNTTWQKFLPFVWSNDGFLIGQDGKSTGVLNPEFIEALEFYAKLGQNGIFDQNTNVRNIFLDGRLGFMLDDPGQISKLRKNNPDLDFGVIPLTLSPRGLSKAFAGADMLAVSRDSKYPEMAIEFIKFMTLPENTILVTKNIPTLFPADSRAIKDPFYENSSDETKLFLNILDNAVSPPANPNWEKIQEILTFKVEYVLFGKMTVQDALIEADQEIRSILLSK